MLDNGIEDHSIFIPILLYQRDKEIDPIAIIQVVDRSKDPSYYGDVQIMIFNVPLKTISERIQVNVPT